MGLGTSARHATGRWTDGHVSLTHFWLRNDIHVRRGARSCQMFASSSVAWLSNRCLLCVQPRRSALTRLQHDCNPSQRLGARLVRCAAGRRKPCPLRRGRPPLSISVGCGLGDGDQAWGAMCSAFQSKRGVMDPSARDARLHAARRVLSQAMLTQCARVVGWVLGSMIRISFALVSCSRHGEQRGSTPRCPAPRGPAWRQIEAWSSQQATVRGAWVAPAPADVPTTAGT